MISPRENLVLLTKKVGKEFVDFRRVLAIFNLWRGLKGPQGPLRILNGPKWTIQCVINILNEIFHYGMISLWENLVLLTKMEVKGISDDFKPILAVINFWRGPQGALRILNGPKWITQCVVNNQNEIFHYEMLSLWENHKEACTRNIWLF